MSEKLNKPTDSELEILNVLWEKEVATVREVHEKMQQNNKETGYTTTLKLMQIMHEKGIVERDSSHKVHVYKPLVTKEKTQNLFLKKMIDGLFSGSSAQLVMQALGNNKSSKEELNEIKKFLDTIE